MAINLKSYSFDGPFQSTESLHFRSGVYAILGKRPLDAQYRVIDIGESQNIRQRVGTHDRAPCWKGHQLPLYVAAYYCDETNRMKVEYELRTWYQPPCGER
jgi:hypothetical protein